MFRVRLNECVHDLGLLRCTDLLSHYSYSTFTNGSKDVPPKKKAVHVNLMQFLEEQKAIGYLSMLKALIKGREILRLLDYSIRHQAGYRVPAR